MRGLARWCMAHRRRVVVAWLAVAILTTVVAHAVGPNYVSVFSLPGTESQRASDLLKREFRAQSGDVDTIVFHVSRGTVDSPAVRAAITPLLARVSALAARRWSRQPLQRAREPSQVSPEPHDRVRDGQLRQAGEPAGGRYRQAAARGGQRGPRARASGRGGRPGRRAGRGLQRRPGHGGRRDRGAVHPAAHLRLARRRRDAADHGRPRPDHRRGADRAGHPRHEHVEHLARPGADDRPRRRHRLLAVHRHPLPRELSSRAATSRSRWSRRWTPPGGRSCSPARPS